MFGSRPASAAFSRASPLPRALPLPLPLPFFLLLTLAVVGLALPIASVHPGLSLGVAAPRGAVAPQGPAAAPLHAGTASSSTLAVGDQVAVLSVTLNCRQAPSKTATVLAVERQNMSGLVVAGSVLASGYVWWEVSWDDNHTGWSAAGDNGTAWIGNLTGHTIWFDRSAARSYAATYWGVVTSDGYFWNSGSTYVSYAQGTSVVGLSGDDCAHYVSQVIGNESHRSGGGLNIPSRVPPTYGEPGAGRLGDLLISNGWAVQEPSVQSLEAGDLINYEWTSASTTWDHVAVYIGNGEVSAHTNSHFGANWTLGGAYVYRFIHILATTPGGSGIDHPVVSLALSPSTGSAPLAVTATAKASGGSTTYAHYLFTWGDGTKSSGTSASATHSYASAGNYSVDVVVTDSLGAKGWAANQTAKVTTGGSTPVTVTLTATPPSGVAPLTVSLAASASGGSGTYASYAWSFGDGSSATTTTATTSHVYANVGTFDAQVAATDSNGASGTSPLVPVAVSAPPAALAVVLSPSATSGAAPITISFTATATGGSGTYSSYAWTFGDGATATTTASTTSHSYTTAGSDVAEVVVSDGTNQATSPSVTLTISSPSGGNPTPLSATLSTAASSGPPPFAAAMTLAISGGSAPYRVSWNYGDGTSTGLIPVSGSTVQQDHTYSTPGAVTATATVVDAAGASTQATLAFSISSSVGPSPSQSTSTSSPFGGLFSSPLGYALLLAGVVAVAALLVGVVLLRRRRGRELPAASEPEGMGPASVDFYGPPPPPPSA